MKIYRAVEAVPSRLEGILHVLRSAGGGYSRETLLQLMQPVPLRTNEDADTLAANSLAALLDLSDEGETLVVEREDERGNKRLVLGEALRAVSEPVFRATARQVLRNTVLRGTVRGEPNQFAELMAWMTWVPAHDVPQGHAEWKLRLRAHGLNLEGYGLANDARWDNVVYWGRYVGLLWQWKKEACRGVVPDATEFIQAHLPLLLEGDSMPFNEFRARLGTACCALDGGSVHGRISEALASTGDIPRDHALRVSPSVSAALRGLRDAGLLTYGCPDDQREFFLMAGGEKIAFVSRTVVSG